MTMQSQLDTLLASRADQQRQLEAEMTLYSWLLNAPDDEFTPWARQTLGIADVQITRKPQQERKS